MHTRTLMKNSFFDPFSNLKIKSGQKWSFHKWNEGPWKILLMKKGWCNLYSPCVCVRVLVLFCVFCIFCIHECRRKTQHCQTRERDRILITYHTRFELINSSTDRKHTKLTSESDAPMRCHMTLLREKVQKMTNHETTWIWTRRLERDTFLKQVQSSKQTVRPKKLY